MGAILGTALRVFAGIGLGELVEKFFPNKTQPQTTDTNRVSKLVIWGLVITAGAVGAGYLIRQLKLKNVK